MTRLVFDIETNGLLPDVDRIHCISTIDVDTEEVRVSNTNNMVDLVSHIEEIQEADEIIGHNIIAYDIPVIQHIHSWFKPKGKVTDTIVMSAVIYPDLKERDWAMPKVNGQPYMPYKYFGRHALEAHGARLGCPKDEYKAWCTEQGIEDPWALWCQEMEDYCIQDTVTNVVLLKSLEAHNFSEECLTLEHQVQTIISRQERHGFLFDVEAAGKLYGVLKERQSELSDILQVAFPPWKQSRGMFTPKVNNKTRGYVKGEPIERFKDKTFNPSSGDDIANRLMELHGWKPKEMTPSGKPKVSEEILNTLKYPHVEHIVEYMMVTKRIAAVAEGKEAYLKKYHIADNRIHGRVWTNGAVTGRMTHSSPNIAQATANDKPYGKEIRSLFIVEVGMKLVGCDADGLELRCLAHYMAKYDGGEYAKTVVEGNKDDGTDAHTVNMKAIGLRKRGSAKTWIYAYLYGAGDPKLGSIVYEDMEKAERPKYSIKVMAQLGKASRAKIAKNLPALAALQDAVKAAAKRKGWLRGLDGRIVPVRHEHAALNTLLQGCGAIIMKKALVLLDEYLQKCNYSYGVDYEFVANVHDEFQQEVKESLAKIVGMAASESIEFAGEYFNFRCPLAGSYAIGNNWSETH